MEIDLEIIKKIASNTFKEKGVKIYLFGSRSRGEHYKTSDIDIAVEGASKISTILFKEALEESKIIHNVDVIYLEEASENLKEEIKKSGKIIWKN